MAFKLRTESVALASNLDNFEAEKKAAAQQGPASLDSFEGKELAKAVETAPEESTSSSDTSSDSSSDSGDDGGGDSGGDDFEGDFDMGDDSSGDDSDPDEPDEPEEEEPDEPDEPEEEEPEESEPEIKTEHFRNMEGIPADFKLRMENSFLDSFSSSAMQAWSGFSFVVGVLASAGIKYGPTVLSGMFKVVLYTFARVFQLMGSIATACEERVTRYMQSYDKQKKRLLANVESMKEVVEKGGVLQDSVKEFQFESPFLGNDSTTDLAKIIRAQADFTSKTFGTLLTGARHEFRQLQEISNNRYIGKHFDAMHYLNDDRNFPGMHSLNSSRMTPADGTSFYTMGSMPAGGFECLASLPNKADNWNQIEKNYNASSFQLVGSGTMASINPCHPKQLVHLLAAIDYMIESNKKHQLFYEELANARSGVFTSVRALFIQLVRSQTRVGFKDSVALPLFLKTSVATKVYLVAAMDLQDHNAKVIANALDYAEKVQKLYRVPSADESASSF